MRLRRHKLRSTGQRRDSTCTENRIEEEQLSQFLSWVAGNPVANVTLTALAAAVVLAVIVTYLIAFFQGREICLWPPKLGARPIAPNRDYRSSTSAVTPGAKKEEDVFQPPMSTAASLEVEKLQPAPATPLAAVRLNSKPIAILHATDGPISRSVYIIETGHRDVTVGKDRSCDLPIESHLLSRHHFRLRISLDEHGDRQKRGFVFELIDSGSTNGTFLNGVAVGKPTVLKNGDLIEAGDCAFTFLILGSPQEPTV
jgi:hypothetical protein